MKYASLLLASVGLLLLASCAHEPPVWQSPLFGKWINRDGDQLEFYVDDTFSLDLKEQNAPEVWGFYAIRGDELVLWNRGADAAFKNGHSLAVYRLIGQRNMIWLRKISDPSEKRSRHLAEIWRRP